MIHKREIIDTATALNLNPHVVEKDYVLGWVLWGISNHPELATTWVFKGGTCLKKCFFETYRFSEDLDFTLTKPAHIDGDFLQAAFEVVGERIYEESGIEIPPDMMRFEMYENPRGQRSCFGRIGYRGPVSPRGNNLPRVKLDLTSDERVVLPPMPAPVFHPYRDEPQRGISTLAYAYEEVFGEKIRALGERTRPRDLYDVINLFRNQSARPAAAVLLDVLQQKCAFKGIKPPDFDQLQQHWDDLQGGWHSMLNHQLPALPPVESFWNELPVFFNWLYNGVVPQGQPAYVGATDEQVIRDRDLRAAGFNFGHSHIEVVRFAASSRLCVDLTYQNTTERIEPYSLRRTTAGRIVLHAHDLDKDRHRSYWVDRIQGTQVTNQTFVPRYEIELSPSGPFHAPPAKRH